MNGQFYCTQAGKFLPCEEALIGERIQCPFCGKDHDVVPSQTPPSTKDSLAETSSVAQDAAVETAKPSPTAGTGSRVSKGGMVMAGLLLFAGLSTLSTPSYESRISSIRAILIGLVFLFRSFYPPLRWWQGFLIFFGSGFATTGLLEFLFADRDINYKLSILVIGAVCSAPLLYFGCKRKSDRQAGDQAASGPPMIKTSDGNQARLAKFSERLLAWLIDLAILCVLAVTIVVVFKLVFPDWAYELSAFPEMAVNYFILFIFGLVIEIIPTHYFGQSLGKRILGLQVTRNSSDDVGLLRSVGRYVLKWTLSMTLFLGGLWILFNKNRKSWHDMICRTRVTKLPGANPKAPTWGVFLKRMIAVRPLSYTLAALLVFFLVSAIAGWGSAQSKWIKKAELLKIKGETEAALSEYNQLIEAHPGFGNSYRMRGQLYAEQFGDIERAIRDYEAAVALNGRDKESLYQLIQLYVTKAQLLKSQAMPVTDASNSVPSAPETEGMPPAEPRTDLVPPKTNGTVAASPSLPAETGIQWRSRPDITPLSLTLKKPLDLGGRSPELVATELEDKTKTTIMRSLDLDPNSDDLREIMKTLDPSAQLPIKRPCFVMTAASGDADSFEVRTLSGFRDRYLFGNSFGEAFVRQYYRIGPYLSQEIRSKESLRIATRFILQPVVAAAWLLLQIPT